MGFEICFIYLGFGISGTRMAGVGFANDSLLFYTDLSRFNVGENVTSVEIDYEIPYYSLSFDADSQYGLRAEIQSTFILKDQKTGQEKKDEKDLTIYITSLEEAKRRGQSALDRREWIFAPGNYHLTLHLKDLHSQKRGSFSTTLIIPPSPKGLSISDIQFAATIGVDTLPSKFTKNDLRVLPAPSRLFSKNHYLLSTYVEIYNLTGNYQVEYTILNEGGGVVKELPAKVQEVGEERSSPFSTIEVGTLNVVALSPGKYRLKVKVKSIPEGSEATSEKEFTVLETPLPPQTPIPEWALEYYDQIEFIASQKDLSFYKSLSQEGKKEFLNRFWKEMDPSPETPENEGFLNFVKRIREADSLFSSEFEKGRKTDRGRILIKYGSPDHVARHPADISYKPYEVWSYYGGGGIQFVFLDSSGFGKYEIIYSTVAGEFTHPKWFELIDPTEVEQKRR